MSSLVRESSRSLVMETWESHFSFLMSLSAKSRRKKVSGWYSVQGANWQLICSRGKLSSSAIQSISVAILLQQPRCVLWVSVSSGSWSLFLFQDSWVRLFSLGCTQALAVLCAGTSSGMRSRRSRSTDALSWATWRRSGRSAQARRAFSLVSPRQPVITLAHLLWAASTALRVDGWAWFIQMQKSSPWPRGWWRYRLLWGCVGRSR